MQRTRRVWFSFQFGASLTFGSFPQRPQRIARRLARRTISSRTLRTAPRVLYARPVGRVRKRPPRFGRRLGPHKALKKESLKKLPPARTAKRWRRTKPPKQGKLAKPAKPAKPSKSVKPVQPTKTTQGPRGRKARPPRDCGWLWVCGDRLATTLLVCVNLLLAGYAGAGLATTARLRYDPTTFLPAREMFPRELARALRYLPLASWAVLAQAHVAAAALVMPRWPRFFMLMLYAALTAAAVAWELRLARREGPALRRRLLAGRARLLNTLFHINMVFDVLVQWNVPHLATLRDILYEVTREAPMNIVVGKRAAEVFVALQAAAAALAVLAAVSGLRRDRRFY